VAVLLARIAMLCAMCCSFDAICVRANINTTNTDAIFRQLPRGRPRQCDLDAVRKLLRDGILFGFEKLLRDEGLYAQDSLTIAADVRAWCLEHGDDPLTMYLADIYTIPANLAGLPAMSVPCGFTAEAQKPLPIGLQLIGKPLDESIMLRAAYAYESTTEWHKQRPGA
jgi:hypothetical protein